MPVTHQEIADRLGLSRTIVTQALHGTRSSRVSAETQQQVRAMARRLGYSPRNLTTHNIGIVASLETLHNETDSALILDIEKELRRRGYRSILIGMEEDTLSNLDETLTSKTMDGVLIIQWQHGHVRACLPPKMPFVVVTNEDGMGDDVDLIAVDPLTTMQHVVEYLLGFGHRRLALLSSVVQSKFYRLIAEGVEKAVAEAAATGATLQVARGDVKDIPHQVEKLMSCRDAPTALILDDLWRATPVIYALRDQGYRIPQDVSVISYADSHQFSAMRPAMTVTDQFRPELAQRAVERLLQKIHTPETIPMKTLIAGEIIERESVGPPPCAITNSL